MPTLGRSQPGILLKISERDPSASVMLSGSSQRRTSFQESREVLQTVAVNAVRHKCMRGEVADVLGGNCQAQASRRGPHLVPQLSLQSQQT